MTSDADSSGCTVQSRRGNIGMTSYIEGPLSVAGNTSYQVSLESLLVGHEDWVYSVEWQLPLLLPGDEAHQPMSILSATLMKSDNPEYFDNVQVLGANMSALGLSQKPICTHGVKESPSSISNNGPDSIDTIPDAVRTVFTEPPVEDQLAWNTLLPESHKLCGHGNELFSICCNHAGKLVASSCKAQSAPVAEIWLWEVGTWKAVGRLQSHNLTVTQMEFSCGNTFLLSVSRDHHLSVVSIRKTALEEGAEHNLVAKQEAHKRTIWACSWNPFGYEFATGSRDRTVKIWCIQDVSSVKQLATLPQFHDSVTALAWMGRDHARNAGLLAVGMDNGIIELWSISGGRADGSS